MPALLVPARMDRPAGSKSGTTQRTGGMGVFQSVSASMVLVSSKFVIAAFLSHVLGWAARKAPKAAQTGRRWPGCGYGPHRVEGGQTGGGGCGMDSNRNPGEDICQPGWIPIGILAGARWYHTGDTTPSTPRKSGITRVIPLPAKPRRGAGGGPAAGSAGSHEAAPWLGTGGATWLTRSVRAALASNT